MVQIYNIRIFVPFTVLLTANVWVHSQAEYHFKGILWALKCWMLGYLFSPQGKSPHFTLPAMTSGIELPVLWFFSTPMGYSCHTLRLCQCHLFQRWLSCCAMQNTDLVTQLYTGYHVRLGPKIIMSILFECVLAVMSNNELEASAWKKVPANKEQSDIKPQYSKKTQGEKTLCKIITKRPAKLMAPFHKCDKVY